MITQLLPAMYREEVIAKALREYRDRLKGNLDANKIRQRELLDAIAEHQLTLQTLSNLLKGKQEIIVQTKVESPAPSVERQTVRETAVEVKVNDVGAPARPDRKGYSREKLKAVAYPLIEMQLADESFEVSRIRELLDNLEPDIKHTYEAAWNLCNDLLREGKLKQAGIKKGEKGVVRLFQLRNLGRNNRSNNNKGSAFAGG